MSPRKVRLVAGLIRGMDVGVALRQLQFVNKAATRPVRKLLESAIANAVHNFNLVPEQLFVKAITVDGGAALKRYRPRAMGRAADIKKRSSHMSITLDERKIGGTPEGAVAAAKVKAPKKAAPKAKAAKKETETKSEEANA